MTSTGVRGDASEKEIQTGRRDRETLPERDAPVWRGVVRGKIAFAVSEEDHQEKLNRLKTIHS